MDYFDRVLEVLKSYESLGVRILDDGTRLIGHVPHIAPEAWLHDIYPPLRGHSIGYIESDIEMALPSVFSEFLARSNGLYTFSGHLFIRGLRRSFSREGDAAWQPYSIKTPNVDERPRRAKPAHLFVGGYIIDGSHVYMDLSDLRVYRCAQWNAKPLHEWPSFEVMLESEVRRLSTLFGRDGRLLNPSLPTTP